MTFEKRKWAPPLWIVLRNFVIQYPMNPTENEKKEAIQVFTVDIYKFMYCDECKYHWRKMMQEYPPDTRSGETLFTWFVECRNRINERTGAPIMVVEDVKDKYRDDNWAIENGYIYALVPESAAHYYSMHIKKKRTQAKKKNSRGLDLPQTLDSFNHKNKENSSNTKSSRLLQKNSPTVNGYNKREYNNTENENENEISTSHPIEKLSYKNVVNFGALLICMFLIYLFSKRRVRYA